MPKRNISYVKPEDPSFLKRMKAKVGYKEGPDIHTKNEVVPQNEPEDRDDNEDEKPTVVVLRPGDLTGEEADKLWKEKQEDDEIVDGKSGKLLFKKPTKKSDLDQLDSNKKSSLDKKKKHESKMKKVKNSSLLSFDEEDE